MNFVRSVQVEKNIHLSTWDGEVKDKILAFWQKRGMIFTGTAGDTLEGRRGNIWGNLTSFDMSRLLARLTVTKSGLTDLYCVLNVDTRYQDITEWNEAYWNLEMDTLESYLLRGDLQEDKWLEFQKGNRTAAWQWIYSLTLRGRNLPRKP